MRTCEVIRLGILSLFLTACHEGFAQKEGFIVLGDLHIDRFEDHDMDYVRTRPQDFAQISKEYPFYTAAYVPRLLRTVKEWCDVDTLRIRAALQLGDLVQGVAGNDRLSRQMARNGVDMLYGAELGVPWVLTKGNHDVSTSPGQCEAWYEVVEPFIERQTGVEADGGMYTYRAGDQFQFFVLDQFFSPDRMRGEVEALEFLKRELPRSDARYKFVLTHQPVIPVTERCWHLFADIRRPLKQADKYREELLELLAEHRAVVLCAHLHEYSRIVRRTAKGPLVQIMFSSVIDRDTPEEHVKMKTEFPSEKDFNREWQPSTNEKRLAILRREAPFIESYHRESRGGYGVFSVEQERLVMRFYPGYGKEPADTWVVSGHFR